MPGSAAPVDRLARRLRAARSWAGLNYRRLVGGAHRLVTAGSPYRQVVHRGRIRRVVGEFVAEVGDWPGVVVDDHRFGGTEFRVAGREICHVHGWGMLDVPYRRPIRDRLVAEGQAARHHVLPDSGWTTYFVERDDDLAHALWLARLSYLSRVARISGDGAPEVDVAAELDGLDVDDELRALVVGPG